MTSVSYTSPCKLMLHEGADQHICKKATEYIYIRNTLKIM